jgi:hypothetical protein
LCAAGLGTTGWGCGRHRGRGGASRTARLVAKDASEVAVYVACAFPDPVPWIQAAEAEGSLFLCCLAALETGRAGGWRRDGRGDEWEGGLLAGSRWRRLGGRED